MLADEPIASLDPLNAKVVMDSLQDINLREGITVITNLHTLDTARTYCNRIIGMAAGKVVFDGPPEELNREAVRLVYGADSQRRRNLRGHHLDQHRHQAKDRRIRRTARARIPGILIHDPAKWTPVCGIMDKQKSKSGSPARVKGTVKIKNAAGAMPELNRRESDVQEDALRRRFDHRHGDRRCPRGRT